MKIMLLGASGQLGREWQRFLNGREGSESFHSYTSGMLDITDFEAVNRELVSRQPSVVINCAAFTDVDRAEKERDNARKVNALAVENLARLCTANSCKLIHYSTDYVFPGTLRDKERFADGYPVDHPADPVNRYGQTKWEGEEAVRRYCEDYLLIRTSWLCGQYGSNFVKSILKAARERNKLRVVNDQWGSPSFAENVVSNSHALFRAGKRGTYHITSTGLTTWYGIARAIIEKKGVETTLNAISSNEYKTGAKRPLFSKLDTRKTEAVPGVVLQDWQTGLNRLLDQLGNR